MPRANRIFCQGFVWHITHRCHQKAFLLKFVRDRRRWRHWLFEAKRRYGLCVLNYIVTSNHIHLLVIDQGNQEIATSMQLVAGRTAQEYNRRKTRNGAFWEDRYHATAVQTNHHLIRCLSYIDLNMVRAQIVSHPSEWEVSGYHEINNPRQRKGIIDHKRLGQLVGIPNIDRLADAHNCWIKDAMKFSGREPVWTESVAVGDEQFLITLQRQLEATGMHRKISRADDVDCLYETGDSYKLLSGSKLGD